MMLFKVFVYGAAGFGLLFLLAVCVGKVFAYGNRTYGQRYTVVWHDTDVMLCAYTGTLTTLDASHVVVEGDTGPVVIDKADIIEVV